MRFKYICIYIYIYIEREGGEGGDLNASKAFEHPPNQREKNCHNVLGGSIGCKDKTLHGVELGCSMVVA